MESRKVITLPNGARIVFDEMPGLRTASVGVYLGAGARHEPADRNGLAHFLEHMAFKGAAGLSARGIAEAVEARGASMNAATDYERTSYFVRCLSNDAPEMLDVALSLVFGPDLPLDEIEREKFVVMQEIGEAADQPDDLVMELAQTASFPDHPLGRPILGVEATLKPITRDDLISFAASAYVPRRTIVSVAGAFDAGAVEAVARRWLEPRTALPPITSTAPGEPRRHAATVARKLEQTHLVLAHPGPHAQSEERFAARIFAEIFGGGMASRLFQEVRESRGLAYTIDASAEQYSDAGRISVFAGCAPADAAEVVELTREIWADLAARGPTDGELQRAKAVAATGYAMAAEAPSARAGSAAYELLAFDRLVPIEEVLRRIDSVTSNDVRQIASACLAAPPIAAAVGPKAGLAAAETFVSHGI